jgi:leader peptidase (prepilin peptidase)/N-methyltransferase
MPPTWQLLSWGLKACWGLLIFAYGACLGSLINVLVYRLPKGISIVTPPSRCPSCQTRLSWRDNIPVFGWIFLRGRCRYCRTKISPEYPIVEAFVGLLFVGLWAYFYLLPTYWHVRWLGVDWVRPWFLNEPTQTWPTFVIYLVLFACMVAMTIIDARTFTIPALLTTVPVVVALVGHPVHAAVVGALPHRAGAIRDQVAGWMWAIPCPPRYRWDLIMASIGGVLGLAVSIGLLKLKLLPQSFADYAEWEESVKKQAAEPAPPEGSTPSTAKTEVPADLWIQYPHARREMVKEALFLAPCLGLMAAGLWFGRWHWHMQYNEFLGQWVLAGSGQHAPIWLIVLSGVLWGYLIGGGIVWAVRILGSLGFGKEAMGLGDVHLMAAVGACLGWIDSGLAFLGAAFVGLAWFLLGTAFSGAFRRTMPYGPYLAVSTLLVVLCKPLIEAGLARLNHGTPVQLPP